MTCCRPCGERPRHDVEEVRLFGLERVRALGMIPNEYLMPTSRRTRSYARCATAALHAGNRWHATDGFFDERFDGPADALAGWRRARDARHRTYMDEAGGDRETTEAGVVRPTVRRTRATAPSR